MASSTEGRAVDRHDWHSPGYVDEWIARDRQRDEERRKRLRDMLSYAPYPANAEIAVLDVGGGYGVVTEEVLRAFPRARVTLQDYSQPMLDRAKQRLASYGGQVQYAAGDLREPGWVRQVGGPFDLVVSAIAIHNLRDPAVHCRVLSGDRRAGQSRWRFSRLRPVRSDRRPRPAAADHRGCRLCRGRMHLAAAAARHHPRPRAARSGLIRASKRPRWCIARLRRPLVYRMVTGEKNALSTGPIAPPAGERPMKSSR